MPVDVGTRRSSGGGGFQASPQQQLIPAPPARGGAGDAVFGQRANISPLMRALGLPAAGQQALVGLTQEAIRREKGEEPQGFGRSAKAAVQRQASFSEIVGDPWLGLTMDVVIDPVNLIPGGALVGAGRKALTLTGLPKALKAIDQVTDSVQSLRKVKDALSSVTVPTHPFRRRNPDILKKAQDDFLDEVAGVTERKAAEAAQEIIDLVPDLRRRQEITKLVELEPLGELSDEALANPRVQNFLQRHADLAPNERQAFDRAREILKELEDIKIESGLLSRKRAADFLQRFGIQYVPRMFARRDFVLNRLDELAEGIQAGDQAALGFGSLEDVRSMIRMVRNIDEVVDVSEVEQLRRFNAGQLGPKPSFTFRRKTTESLDELVQIVGDEVETDLATILGQATRETLKSTSGVRYIDNLTNWMLKEGLLLEQGGEARSLIGQMRARGVPEDIIKARMREGFVSTRDIMQNARLPEELKAVLGDAVIPRTIAKEIEHVIRQYRWPEEANTVYKSFVKIQNMWKAWTLSIFPAYHSRNLISNLWNNYLAGLGDPLRDPSSLQNYDTAFHLMRRGISRKFNGKELVAGLTDKELWRIAQDKRIIGAGEFAGELDEIMGALTDKSNIIEKIFNPRANKGVQKMFQVGRKIEDHSRLSHFMWRLSKGDSIDDAAKSVHKFLFDYKYGLSGFEQNVLRNVAVPFWAWTRFNIPLQLEMLVTQPTKFTAVGKAKRTIENQFGGPAPEEVYLSDWLKHSENIRINYDEEKGQYEYFVMDGWWPASDLNKIFSPRGAAQEILNMVSPFLKVPAEIVWNYNLFRRRPVTDFPGQTKPLRGLTGAAVSTVGGAIAGPVGTFAGAVGGAALERQIAPEGVDLPARMEHLLRNVRLINDIDRTLQLLDQSGWEQAILRPTLGRVYPIRMEQQAKWWEFSMRRRIRELQRQRKIAENRGELDNVARLDALIATGEDRLKEFAPAGNKRRRTPDRSLPKRVPIKR